MKIIDCFVIHNVNDIGMLTHRLDMMDAYVERFIIVESIYDYRGNPKEICCTPSFLESLKCKNKITHIK